MNYKILLLLLLPTLSWSKTLDIPRIKQETDMWCWLASSEMVNKYHGACSIDKDSSMQCSTVRYMAYAGLVPPACLFDCRLCAYPAYRMENFKIPLDRYTSDSAKNCGNSVVSTLSDKAASKARVKKEIDLGRPMIVGINPSLTGKKPVPEHAAVLIGYYEKGGELFLRINDPYDYPVSGDPYISVGAKQVGEGVYDITYKELLKSFSWQSTIYIKQSKK